MATWFEPQQNRIETHFFDRSALLNAILIILLSLSCFIFYFCRFFVDENEWNFFEHHSKWIAETPLKLKHDSKHAIGASEAAPAWGIFFFFWGQLKVRELVFCCLVTRRFKKVRREFASKATLITLKMRNQSSRSYWYRRVVSPRYMNQRVWNQRLCAADELIIKNDHTHTHSAAPAALWGTLQMSSATPCVCVCGGGGW